MFNWGRPKYDQQNHITCNISTPVPSWSPWSSWSACSCFTITETRRRFCRIVDPAVQGFCSGPIIEQRPCIPTMCSVSPGGWSEWSDWSSCSKDCKGTGHQIRNRMCSEPIPANRGPYCAGYSFDQRPCTSTVICGNKVDGGWSSWGEWSACSDPSLFHQVASIILSDTAQILALRMVEVHVLVQILNFNHVLMPLSATTQWMVTGDYGPLGANALLLVGLRNCGLGSRIRVRACVSPAPSFGGAPCFGRSSQSEECQAELAFCSRFLHHSDILDAEISVLRHYEPILDWDSIDLEAPPSLNDSQAEILRLNELLAHYHYNCKDPVHIGDDFESFVICGEKGTTGHVLRILGSVDKNIYLLLLAVKGRIYGIAKIDLYTFHFKSYDQPEIIGRLVKVMGRW
uniref:TSP1_spondin domain-containing protein n=1 Tax=Heterorhabditis bacteriophora TaxID=37862 RepID=A0A1I7X474_HETBA